MKAARLLLAALVLATSAMKAAQPAGNKNLSEEMRLKLHYAQAVLEGITTENYPFISTNAARLKQLSTAPGWQAKDTPEFRRLTEDYVRATESLSKAAAQRNIDAATLAYFRLSTSCVNCHKYLRGADVGMLPSGGNAPKIKDMPQAVFNRSQIQ